MQRRPLVLALAGLHVALACLGFVFVFLRNAVIEQLEHTNYGDPSNVLTSAQLVEKLDRYRMLESWGIRGLGACVLAITILLAIGLPRVAIADKRVVRIAIAAVVLVAAGLALDFYDPKIEGELRLEHKLLFLASFVVPPLGTLSLLGALAKRARRESVLLLPLIVLGLAGAFDAYLVFGNPTFTPGLQWVVRIAFRAPDLALALAAFFLAKDAGDVKPTADADRAGHASFPGIAFRTLGATLYVRLGIGLVTQGMFISALVSKDFAGAGSSMSLAILGSVVVAILGLVGLVAYFRVPEDLRSGSLIAVALTLQLFATCCEFWAASAADKLFSMADKATKATSMWAMPSLREMEELQDTLTWGGRIGLVLGVVAAAALLAALRGTARALGSRRLDEIGQSAQRLLVIAGVLGIVAGLLVGMRDGTAILVMMALGLLGVGIALLVAWTKLLFGLARLAEQGGGDDEPETRASETPA